MPDDERLKLGYVSGVYGVKGWLKIFSYADPKENILTYPVWQVLKNRQIHRLEIENAAVQGKRIVAKLTGIDDRNAAELWLNSEIYIDRTDLPKLEDDEFYWTDLQGLTVITLEGVILGKVEQLLETGANDVLVVSGERERLIPFVLEHIVQVVDLESGIIRVDWSPDFE